MAEPTFLICGGQRCGTTTLWHLLNEHPEVFIAQPVNPEPKYFLDAPDNPARDYESRYFSDTRNAVAVGEKSTSYFEDPRVPERIAGTYPEVKLVFMLRHPVERAVSNYLFSVMNGLETRSFEDAIVAADKPETPTSVVKTVSPFAYVERSRYAERLAPFQNLFPSSQMMFSCFDDLVDHPSELCSQLFEFLHVDPQFVPPLIGSVTHAGPTWEPIMSRRTLDSLLASFESCNDVLSKLLQRDLSHWNEPTQKLVECVH